MIEHLEISDDGTAARKMDGLMARIAQRLLAFGTCIWHNREVSEAGRSLIAYDH